MIASYAMYKIILCFSPDKHLLKKLKNLPKIRLYPSLYFVF